MRQRTRIGNGWPWPSQLAAGNGGTWWFNIAEGVYGRSREAQVPCLCEMYGIPYTFSDPLVCALTLDKAMTNA
jgi:D-alanine-D-alanine ligase